MSLFYLFFVSCESNKNNFDFQPQNGNKAQSSNSQNTPETEEIDQTEEIEEIEETEEIDQTEEIEETDQTDQELLECYDLNGNPMPCEGSAEGEATNEYANDCYDPNGNVIPCGDSLTDGNSICFDPVTNEEVSCSDTTQTTGSSGDILDGVGLVITEIMFDPSGNNSLQQWFEIYVTCLEPINLEGLVLSNGFTTTVLPEFWVEESGFVLLGRNADVQSNGGLEIDIEYDDVLFSLGNTDGLIAIYDGTQLVDQVPLNSFSYFGSWTEGTSIQFHQGLTSNEINDQETMWCASSYVMSNGDLGTPKSQNRTCPAP